MDVLLLVNSLRYYSSLKLPFRHNSARKILFLSACYIWNDRVSSREMDQYFPFCGLIGYRNSFSDSVFRYCKVFRLHAILHDAAWEVRSHIGKGPGYCNMIGRGPSSCLLSHVTGLLVCLYVKIFLPTSFILVDFWNSISLIVLDIELTEKNKTKELGLFIDGSLRGFSFCPLKIF